MRLLAVLLLCAPLLSAQSPLQPSAHDRAIEASGGSQRLAALRDYVASGTITYFEGEHQSSGSATLRYRAGGLLRLDTVSTRGPRVWVLRGLAGEFKEGGAKKTRLSPEVVNSLRNYSLPASVLNGTKKEHVTAQDSQLTARPAQRILQAETKYDIDPMTGRVVRVSSEVRARPGAHPVLQEFFYSDFRIVDGILFPFVIEEHNAGVLVSRIRLETISTNNGLTAADFNLE